MPLFPSLLGPLLPLATAKKLTPNNALELISASFAKSSEQASLNTQQMIPFKKRVALGEVSENLTASAPQKKPRISPKPGIPEAAATDGQENTSLAILQSTTRTTCTNSGGDHEVLSAVGRECVSAPAARQTNSGASEPDSMTAFLRAFQQTGMTGGFFYIPR